MNNTTTSTMKVIIAGSRNYEDYSSVEYYMDYLKRTKLLKPTEIVSGTAKGADKLGERRAKENNIPIQQYPADRETLGRKAGPIRNEQMAQYADTLVAFRDGKSRGTKGMIELAKQYGLEVYVYKTLDNTIN